MENSQLSSYTAKVVSLSQTQAIEAVQKTLSAQSGLLSGSLASLNRSTFLDELQALLGIWNEEDNSLNSLDVSILVEASKISATVSAAGKVVASISEIVRSISIDWNSYDRSKLLFSADNTETPLKIEQETHRSIGSITLVSYQTISATMSGSETDIAEVVAMLAERGSTPEQISVANIQRILACIDPQKIKLDLKYCLLFLNGVEIPFKENSLQMNILRAMFGKRGRNRVKLGLVDFYEIWAKEQRCDIDKTKKSTTKQDWDWFDDKNTVGMEKEKFIKQIRNATAAINDKVRKSIGWTEDFLEVRNNECRINPKLLKSKNFK